MYKENLMVIIGITFFLSGCIGGVAGYPVECDFDYPISDYTYTKTEFGPCEGAEVIRFSKNDFLQWWGEPDEIVKSSTTKEVWIYNRKTEDCGVVAAFVIIVPLTSRSCEVFDEITFENDIAIHVHFKRIGVKGAVFGFDHSDTPLHATQCPTEKNHLDAITKREKTIQ